jgi:hypothetical protein
MIIRFTPGFVPNVYYRSLCCTLTRVTPHLESKNWITVILITLSTEVQINRYFHFVPHSRNANGSGGFKNLKIYASVLKFFTANIFS